MTNYYLTEEQIKNLAIGDKVYDYRDTQGMVFSPQVWTVVKIKGIPVSDTTERFITLFNGNYYVHKTITEHESILRSYFPTSDNAKKCLLKTWGEDIILNDWEKFTKQQEEEQAIAFKAWQEELKQCR